MPTLVDNAIGQCVFAQSGCLYNSREYYNGYQIIDITVDDGHQIDVSLRTWFNQPRRAFGPAENICAGGKKTFVRTNENNGPKKLRVDELLRIQTALDNYANTQAAILHLKKVTFDESFTCPPLSHKTEEDLLKLKPMAYKNNLLDLTNVFSEKGVLVFSGARESGKTTTALKIAKETLHQKNGDLKIPILVDFTLVKNYKGIDQIVRQHFTALETDIPASRVLSCHRCLFIVDNVSFAEQEKIETLRKLVAENRDAHDWLIFLDHDLFKAERAGGILVQDGGPLNEWYKKQLAEIYPVAASRLAVMYANGNGVPQNYQKARDILIPAP